VETPFAHVPSFAAGGRNLNVIVETPRGAGHKYRFDPETGLFKLGAFLPAGMWFPYDFGFVPQTLAEDGDPLDVLILMDDPSFPGCLVEARPIGVIEAKQKEEGRTFRNDRVIAVAAESRVHAEVRTLRDAGARLLEEIESFFATKAELSDKRFHPLARRGSDVAIRLVKQAQEKARSGSGVERTKSEPRPARKHAR
jgi:inorganic pyrophosphatase